MRRLAFDPACFAVARDLPQDVATKARALRPKSCEATLSRAPDSLCRARAGKAEQRDQTKKKPPF
jgi:hypothetical protein